MKISHLAITTRTSKEVYAMRQADYAHWIHESTATRLNLGSSLAAARA